jgi:energy-coupling factor transporter ATP-binding protein EcfA2
MPYISNLNISQWRTFGRDACFDFECPDGKPGPHLNLIVGRNNAGKSTVVQAFKLLAQSDDDITISKSDRRTEDSVRIDFKLDNGADISIGNSIGGSVHKRTGGRLERLKIIDARRPWQTSAGHLNRIDSANFWQISSGSRQTFDERNDWTYQNAFSLFSRIASDVDKKRAFDSTLREVFPFVNDWRLENDLGKHFIEYKSDASVWHSIALTGEGLINAFMLLGSLFDTSDTDVVVIDEPELSLHPQAQRRLFRLLLRKSTETQIIVATHSPHFITWESLGSGVRVFRINPGANAHPGHISKETGDALRAIAIRDFKNRRMFDALSRELFFSDSIIFVEGPEDVHLLEQFAAEKGMMDVELFGYGAGGADNIEKWLQACKELGIMAGAIYDKNKQEAADKARSKFPEFPIEVLPTDDIRDKRSQTVSYVATEGMFTRSGTIKPEFEGKLSELLKRVVSQSL